MKAAVVVALLATPSVVAAQTVQELQRQVDERDAEILRLRQRINELEGRPEAPAPGQTPAQRPPLVLAPPPATPSAATETFASGAEDEDRALERALVRQGGRLVPDGKFEVEPNFVYSHASVESNNFRRDSYGPGIDVRVGLPFSSQFDVSTSYVWERRSSDFTSSRSNGVGDLSIALSHDFQTEAEYIPNLIGFAGYNFATGENTIFSNTTHPVAHGAGFDSFDGGFTATKRVDPLVYYGGYTFTHYFSGTQDGNSVDLGNSHELRMGSILAASPFTSIRATLDVTWYDRTEFNGRGLSGSDEPSAIIGIGGAVLLPPSSLLDVSVGAGLTRNSPDFRITVAYPVRF